MSIVILDPGENPDAYDYITLDGLKSPGPCKLAADCARVLNIDVQQSVGFNGAFLRYAGEDLPKLQYKLRLWTKEHFKDAGPFVTLLMEGYARGVNRAMSITDQAIAHLKIAKCVVKEIGSLRQVREGEALHELNFTLQTFQRRKSVVAAPRGSNKADDEIKTQEEANNVTRRAIAAARVAAGRGK